MKIDTALISDIQFERKPYDPSLKESLLRRGLCFPLQIRADHNSLICVDGAKRLSAITDILKEAPEHKLKYVQTVLLNHARSASTQAKNHH